LTEALSTSHGAEDLQRSGRRKKLGHGL
jgi:hypothetical protein